MGRVRCQFCHKFFDEDYIDEHYEQHTKLRPDGQQTDYITAAPDERYTGSLRGVPRNYEHQTCGAVTGMPEEIIRSYLANPFLYANNTFCTGCGEQVPWHECVWIETGEDLQTYNDRLRRKAGRRGGGGKRRRKGGFWEMLKRLLFKEF